MGNPDCSFLELGLYIAIDHIAMLAYYNFPDRPDRCLYVGDACCYNGSCIGHPRTSHWGSIDPSIGWRSIDFNYYTLVGYDSEKYHYGNRTQYVVGLEDSGTTNLWSSTHPNDQSKMKLRPNIFDAERNAYFYIGLRNLLSHDGFLLGAQQILLDEMRKVSSYDDSKLLYTYFNGDHGKAFNHHKHVHANLRTKKM